MFKFFTLTAVATLTAGAAIAQTATDAPSWIGPYVGIHGGYGFDGGQKVGVSGNDPTTDTATAIGNRSATLNQNRAGALGINYAF